ncbi:MAG: hypothetical protein AMJ54_13720 [Deltaproteobacteria bacterium SG8_13]|nr:MAG: hypothetical protein AMJ54_13720 [Deltaproteobacteria bacterium SG8_13]
MFQDDGIIFYSGNKWTKSQIADSDPEEWSRFNISLFNLVISITDKEATVNTVLTAKMGFDKWKLPVIFTLTKENDKWLISEVTGYGSAKTK